MAIVDPKREITTIVPTFRRPRLLQRAIRSVLSQTYPHFRVCVYDNASGDETRSVVEEFAKADARIHYSCHPQNIGGLRNFIYGMEHVGTPFFSLLGDDDYLLPDFYETAMAGFERRPEAFLSATATLQVDNRGSVLAVSLADADARLYPASDGMVPMIRNGPANWTGIVFRREVPATLGPLDVEIGGPSDLDFELRAAARFPVVISTQPGAVFTVHRESAGNSAGAGGLCPGFHKIVRNVEEDAAIPTETRDAVVRSLNKWLRGSLLHVGVGAIIRGNWVEADCAARCLSQHFQSPAGPLLNASCRACRRWRLCRFALLRARSLNRILGTARRKELQTHYAPYVRTGSAGTEPSAYAPHDRDAAF